MNRDLLDAVRAYTLENANLDGLACPPVPGLRMMCADSPRRKLESTYRPLVCLILQGSKHLLVGTQQRTCGEGVAVIVGADMPVTGQIVGATRERPYIALAIDLDLPLLGELAHHMRNRESPASGRVETLFTQPVDDAILDCACRLVRLIGRPDAIPVLHPVLMRELHFWLLSGPHAAQLGTMVSSDNSLVRLSRSISLLRTGFSTRLRTEELASAASMSLTAFHKHFKELTSLTPGQYQKRLRLIEARRLITYEGMNASRAAYQVGYESVSQFTREYTRMYGTPPKRHARDIPVPGHGALAMARG